MAEDNLESFLSDITDTPTMSSDIPTPPQASTPPLSRSPSMKRRGSGIFGAFKKEVDEDKPKETKEEKKARKALEKQLEKEEKDRLKREKEELERQMKQLEEDRKKEKKEEEKARKADDKRREEDYKNQQKELKEKRKSLSSPSLSRSSSYSSFGEFGSSSDAVASKQTSGNSVASAAANVLSSNAVQRDSGCNSNMWVASRSSECVGDVTPTTPLLSSSSSFVSNPSNNLVCQTGGNVKISFGYTGALSNQPVPLSLHINGSEVKFFPNNNVFKGLYVASGGMTFSQVNPGDIIALNLSEPVRFVNPDNSTNIFLSVEYVR